MPGLQTLLPLLGGALSGLLFRSVPFISYALISPRVGRVGKLAASALFAGLIACGAAVWGGLAQPLAELTFGWAYFGAAAIFVHALTPWLGRAGGTTAGLLIASATLFMLVPALLLRNNLTVIVLATGFELSFAAQSYVAETSKPHARTSLGAALTFLLVNPTLFYHARGHDLRTASLSPRAVARATASAACLVAVPLVGQAVSLGGTLLASVGGSASAIRQGLVSTAILCGHLCVQYFGHSSLASYQIGLMRLFGHQVPERYVYPFLATTPDDFWRRWNTYLGVWLQRYVFLPLAAKYQRRLPQRVWTLGKGLALLAAFTVCGLAHEAAGYALRFRVPLGALLAFMFYGTMVGLYLCMRMLLARAFGHAGERSTALRGLAAAASFTFSATVLLAFGWMALPALAGLGLNAEVYDWLAP